MSRKRAKKGRCPQQPTGAKRIRIAMASGQNHKVRGRLLAEHTVVAPRLGNTETLTVTIYLLSSGDTMGRVYHRIEPSDGASRPVRVRMDVVAQCGSLDEMFEFLLGLGLGEPITEWLRTVRQQEAQHPRTARPAKARQLSTSGFRILAGSLIPA